MSPKTTHTGCRIVRLNSICIYILRITINTNHLFHWPSRLDARNLISQCTQFLCNPVLLRILVLAKREERSLALKLFCYFRLLVLLFCPNTHNRCNTGRRRVKLNWKSLYYFPIVAKNNEKLIKSVCTIRRETRAEVQHHSDIHNHVYRTLLLVPYNCLAIVNAGMLFLVEPPLMYTDLRIFIH